LKKRLSILLAVLYCTFAQMAAACPSCYGDPDSPMTSGMNAAIMILLGITGSVLAGVTIFFVYLRKRWVAVNRPFQNMLN